MVMMFQKYFFILLMCLFTAQPIRRETILASEGDSVPIEFNFSISNTDSIDLEEKFGYHIICECPQNRECQIEDDRIEINLNAKYNPNAVIHVKYATESEDKGIYKCSLLSNSDHLITIEKELQFRKNEVTEVWVLEGEPVKIPANFKIGTNTEDQNFDTYWTFNGTFDEKNIKIERTLDEKYKDLSSGYIGSVLQIKKAIKSKHEGTYCCHLSLSESPLQNKTITLKITRNEDNKSSAYQMDRPQIWTALCYGFLVLSVLICYPI